MSRIFVVEDEFDLAKAARRVLASAGYDVAVAHDGQAALSMLETMDRLPTLILLDLAMPKMDGWGVLKALNGDTRLAGVPVIIVSAYADERLVGTHARMRISKPYSHEELLSAVQAFAPQRTQDPQ